MTEEAKLIIRAPFRLSEKDILKFVSQKRKWIERKRREIARRPKPLALTKEQQQAWLKLAEEKIPERCKYYSEVTGLAPTSVRINNAKTRWGSCGAKGRLNFTWRLILAPVEVIDYVVVHELMHLVERNHSQRFWRRVGEIIPAYQARRRWLRKNGSRIG